MADDETTATVEQETAGEAATGSDPDDILAGARNPDAVKAAIDRQKQAAKEARQRAEDAEAKLRSYEDQGKSAQEKLEERASGAETRAEKAETKLLKFEIAAAKGVPLSQAHRLQGSTKKELEEDADAFLRDYTPGAGGGGRQLDGGARKTPPKAQDMDSMIRKAAGRE